MPRVLRIINRLNLGGPTYNAAFLSKYLAPEFETKLVAGIKEDTEESSEYIVERMGLQPVYIPEMRRDINFKNDRIAYKKIKAIIREFRPDIVHTHAAKAGTLGRLAAINMNVPVILHTFHGHVFHSYFNRSKTFIFKSIEKYLSNRSTRIIAISDLQKHELCNIHKVASEEKTVVIPLGFDLARFRIDIESHRKTFRSQYGIGDDVLIIMIIGRVVPVKNHSLFIQSLKMTLDKYQGKAVGMIVGDGEDRGKMEKLAIETGLIISTPEKREINPNLIFTSWIKDIESPLAGADIIAMTSLNEGTPVSLIEAQAAGKAIASTNVGGIANVVMPGKTALLSPPDRPDLFSDNLLQLLNDKELRTSMQDDGWPHVKHSFNFERLVDDMRKLYHELLSKDRR